MTNVAPWPQIGPKGMQTTNPEDLDFMIPKTYLKPSIYDKRVSGTEVSPGCCPRGIEFCSPPAFDGTQISCTNELIMIPPASCYWAQGEGPWVYDLLLADYLLKIRLGTCMATLMPASSMQAWNTRGKSCSNYRVHAAAAAANSWTSLHDSHPNSNFFLVRELRQIGIFPKLDLRLTNRWKWSVSFGIGLSNQCHGVSRGAGL